MGFVTRTKGKAKEACWNKDAPPAAQVVVVVVVTYSYTNPPTIEETTQVRGRNAACKVRKSSPLAARRADGTGRDGGIPYCRVELDTELLGGKDT